MAAGHYALIASIDARLEDRVSRLGEPLAREFEENEHAILRLAAQPELAASVFPEAKQQLEGLRTEADRREFARTASRRMLEDKLRALAGTLPAGDFLDIRDAAGRRVTQTAIEATLPGALLRSRGSGPWSPAGENTGLSNNRSTSGAKRITS